MSDNKKPIKTTPDYQIKASRKYDDKTYRKVTVRPAYEFFEKISEYCQKHDNMALNQFFLLAAEKLLEDNT